jgi:mannose-1-phosphate guanylyltransferase/mannose-6-phosphate isomerase
MKITPVILSGGSGTRLWPVSRRLNPKQFIDFFGKDSLFQKTILRAEDKNSFHKPIVVCNNEHRFMAADELQKIKVEANAIILEPVGKNTAPAIAIAALEVMANHAKNDDIMLVMPSDHIIRDEEKFIEAIKNAVVAAQQNYLVTFGIVPDKAETGYGYIKKAQKVENFSDILR